MNAMQALLPTHAMFIEAATSERGHSCPQVQPSLREHNPIAYLDRGSQLQHRIIQTHLARHTMDTLDTALDHLAYSVDGLRATPNELDAWGTVLVHLLGAASCRGLTVRDLVDAATLKVGTLSPASPINPLTTV